MNRRLFCQLIAVAMLSIVSMSAFAQCNPTNAPPSSAGCQPLIGSAADSDTMLVWEPALFPAALRQITIENLFMGRTLPNTNLSNSVATATNTTTSRTIANFFADLPSAKDFGAVGDGVTLNNTAFANIANNATTPVFLPAGTYLINPQTFSMAHGISLIGAGRGLTIIKIANSSNLSADLFDWTGQNGFSIRDFTIDLNNSTNSTLVSAIGLTTDSNFDVSGIEIINASTGMLLIGVDAPTNYKIVNNYLALTTPATTQNQCLNISTASGASHSGLIQGNVCVNTAMLAEGSELSIDSNDISGYEFGSGLAVAPGSVKVTISHNTLHDSGVNQDSNSVFPAGIETYANDSVIDGNITFNNAADGIQNAGKHTVVTNNTSFDNGRASDGSKGSGFLNRFISSSINAGGSIYSGNVAYDSGAGNQIVGFGDNGAPNNITLGLNSFEGTVEAYNLTGTQENGVIFNNDGTDAGTLDIRQNGSVGITVANPPSTISHLFVQGGTASGGIELGVESSEANASFLIRSKGTSPLIGEVNGATQFLAEGPATTNDAPVFSGTNGSGGTISTLNPTTGTLQLAPANGLLQISAHPETHGSTPINLSAGTSASIAGNDSAGIVLVGTSPSTTVSFTFFKTWTNPPVCFAQDQSSAVTMRATSISTSAVIFTASATLTATDIVSYICLGYD